MSDKTKIEWSQATWNCVTGCTKVSAGCDHCYAETFAERWRASQVTISSRDLMCACGLSG